MEKIHKNMFRNVIAFLLMITLAVEVNKSYAQEDYEQGWELFDERVKTRFDIVPSSKILDGKWGAVGSKSTSNVPGIIKRKVVGPDTIYHFSGTLGANRVEITEHFVTEERLNEVGLNSNDPIVQKSIEIGALGDLYSDGVQFGQTVVYEWSSRFPEAIIDDPQAKNVSGGIFAQWHGSPDRTLIKFPDEHMEYLSVEAYASMIDTIEFFRHGHTTGIGYDKLASEDYTNATPNGYQVDGAAGGPIAAFVYRGGIRGNPGYMYFNVSSDAHRMSTSAVKVSSNVNVHAQGEVVQTPDGLKQASWVYRKLATQVPVNQWIGFRVEITYTKYNPQADEVLQSGGVKIWINDVLEAEWQGNVGKNDIHGPVFQQGMYKPGPLGFKVDHKGFRQYIVGSNGGGSGGNQEEMEITAVADTYVSGGGNSTESYGSNDAFIVQGGTTNARNNKRSLVKFDLSGVDLSKVESAVLKLTPTSGQQGLTSMTQVFGLSNDSWQENLTYQDFQLIESDISSSELASSNGGGSAVEEFDITNYVKSQSDGTLSLVLKGSLSSEMKEFYTKEALSASSHPTLVITSEVPEPLGPTSVDPAADTYVSGGGNSTKSYGSNDAFNVQGGTTNARNNKRGLIKFDLSGIDLNQVESAVLKLTPTSGQQGLTSSTQVFGLANDSWQENLTYQDFQLIESDVSSSELASTNGGGSAVEEFDITNYVKSQSDETLSLVIKGGLSSEMKEFYSKEAQNASNRPVLVLNDLSSARTATSKSDLIETLESEGTTELMIYPNPASSYFNLSYIFKEAGTAYVTVIDSASGKKVLKFQQKVSKGKKVFQIDAKKLTSALYIVELSDEQNVVSRKRVVIQ